MGKLNYDQFQLYEFGPHIDLEAIEERKCEYIVDCIISRINKMDAKINEIENLNYEKDLILRDIIDVIKLDLCASDYNIVKFLSNDPYYISWKYFYNKNELDEDNKPEYEATWKMVEKQIKSRLIPDEYEKDIVFNSIFQYNRGDRYEFHFTLNKINYIISIPNFNNVSGKNYKDLLDGYKLYILSNSTYSLQFKDLNPNRFKSRLKDFLEAYAI